MDHSARVRGSVEIPHTNTAVTRLSTGFPPCRVSCLEPLPGMRVRTGKQGVFPATGIGSYSNEKKADANEHRPIWGLQRCGRVVWVLVGPVPCFTFSGGSTDWGAITDSRRCLKGWDGVPFDRPIPAGHGTFEQTEC